MIILGASGQGREIAAAARDAAILDPAWSKIRGFLDDAPEMLGRRIGSFEVLGPTRNASDERSSALLGVGYPEVKARVVHRVDNDVTDWPVLIHPHALIGERVTIERGCFVQAGCILTCDIQLSEFVTLNTGVTIGHDVRIAKFCTLAPGVHIGGNVSVEEGAFIGIGASVKHGVTIGEWSIIGAGAAVIENVKANSVVGGVPGRQINVRKSGWQCD